MRTKEEAGRLSRRRVLAGSAMLLVGGAAGRAAAAVTGDAALVAPPLPWKWTPIDPLEAGRRAYRAYFEHGG